MKRTIIHALSLAALCSPLGGCLFPADDEPSTHEDDLYDWDWAEPAGAAGSMGGAAGSSAGSNAGAAGTDMQPSVEPFSTPFEGLVPNQVVHWANFDVSATAVRHVRGLHAEGGWGMLVLDPAKTYVELELGFTNRGNQETDLRGVDTWDLVLASGERLRPVDGLDVRLLAGDSTTSALHYEVLAPVDLAGASLVLEGGVRGVLEPERVPLDQAYVASFPKRISSLVGQTIAYRDDVSIHVDEAVYDVNVERRGRAPAGQRVVWLRLAYTATEWDILDPRDVRLVVNGRASAPTHYDSERVSANTTVVMSAHFLIDATATHFEIVVPRTGAEAARFPVDVAALPLATDL